MSEKKWRLPETSEEFDRASERFRVATAALRNLNDWLDRKGFNPPECVMARAAALNMPPEAYYKYYTALHKRDWLDSTEQHAIEDWAIQQVQPEWKRNPTPKYPSGL